jgi:hypothetical protein
MGPAPDAVMETLAVLRVGVEFRTHEGTGEMCVLRRDGVGILVGDELDELVARGWVSVDGDEVSVTESGNYQLRRWLKRTNRELDYGRLK